ncbi:MAG: DevR family CRISPR-associated autoregulator [Nitrososphaerota archaeon]|jgi:CRISPR-associated protein Cst2|nr:DevR family CRISPR-associated autoregulator [Nitrososphaerota archaeon]
MTKYLYGLIVTPYGVAANNRGENEGNITTLQKLLWNGEVFTTVSAEAIRWSLRYQWQRNGIQVNRVWDEVKNDHSWQDPRWLSWTEPEGKETFIDDDVLGFMVAEAASTEGDEALSLQKKERDDLQGELNKMSPEDRRSEEGRALREKLSGLKAEIKQAGKGKATKRRGALEVTRAISLTPFAGDITFNAKSGEKTNTSLYGTEVHATRYQYAFAVTPGALQRRERIMDVVDAFVSLSQVGGNQSRFLFDFSPEAVVFRWTDDFAPRILYGFSLDQAGNVTMPSIIRKMESGDIDPREVVAGGPIVVNDKDRKFQSFPGVKAAAEEIKKRIRSDLSI